jgi:hypothetical protein
MKRQEARSLLTRRLASGTDRHACRHPPVGIDPLLWRRFPDVAQGFYSALTILGILLAPPGALYWHIVGAWLAGRGSVGQPGENRGAPWGTVIIFYVACLVVVAALIGLTR